MFSFHKPKIYRSLQGCCICRAKSSSSRFTDSKRYENDFEQCFQIRELRQGEICNACVLLVKRWKKLPAGSTRNWHHVVDARAGPGTKSITKIKNRAKEELKEDKKLKKHKHRYQPRKIVSSPANSCASSPAAHRATSPSLSDDIYMSDLSMEQSDVSDDDDSMGFRPRMNMNRINKRRVLSDPVKHRAASCVLLDTTYWKRTEVCCGIIYIGNNHDVLIESQNFHPCDNCSGKSPPQRAAGKRLDSESSTESGVVCEEDLKFPTPPITQPSSPASEHLQPAECSVKFSAKDLVLDLTSAETVESLDEEDELLFDEDEEEEEEEEELGAEEEELMTLEPQVNSGVGCIA